MGFLREEHDSLMTSCNAEEPNKRNRSWANIAGQVPKPEKSNYTLEQLLKGLRPDKRLMVRLGEESPYRKEHPFILQKKQMPSSQLKYELEM